MTTAEIQSIPLFDAIPSWDRASAARHADRVTIPAGRTLTRQGELADEFFVILDGTAEVECDGQLVGQLGTGDFLGELGLLGSPFRTATVRAQSELEVAVLGRREFRYLLRRFPEFASTVLLAASRRMARSVRLAEAAL